MRPKLDDPNRPDCKQCGKPMWIGKGKTVGGRTRYICGACAVSSTGSNESQHNAGYDLDQAEQRVKNLKSKIKSGLRKFVITAAQDTTNPYTLFFQSLKTYCQAEGAELIIVPVHYKNVSLYTGNREYNKRWASDLEPFLIDAKVNLGGGVILMGNIKVGATAANPLEGMHSIGGDKTTIFGHSQLGMEPVATPLNKKPKRMYTTGAVTRKNYSESKAGAKAEFHHVFGALVVEIGKGNRAFIRQLNADNDGGFYDLDKYYEPDRVTDGHRALSLTAGDEHVKWMAKGVKKATYTGQGSITEVMRPNFIVRHDVFDAYAISHHHEKDPLVQYRKYAKGWGKAQTELEQVADHINETTPPDCINLIVASNHHDHLKKWLDRANANTDHQNAHLILELQKLMREAVDGNEKPDPFELYLAPRLKHDTEFLDRNTPYLLKGVDHSQHGDVGVNGSRGSAKALANTTHKLTIGHSHTARIVKSVYQTATSTGALEYQRGLSTHTNTHVLQYPSGKRTLIDIINGQWRA